MNIPIVTPDQMYKLDQVMTEKYGIPAPVLMENAAKAVFNLLINTYKDLHARRLVIFIGPGNNGEDALVLSRQLAVNGFDLLVVILPPLSKCKATALAKIETLTKLDVTIMRGELPQLNPNDIVIDGIFGIGLTRPPQGIYKGAIVLINKSGVPVVSIDISSGIDGETGITPGVAVKSDFCVSFGNIKIGNILYNGYTHCDELQYTCLNSPYNQEILRFQNHDLFLNTPLPLPVRDKTGYKNAFGTCLVVGGSDNYHGAPFFASAGFMKSGGGYAHLITTAEVSRSVSSLLPECVLHPFPKNTDGTLPQDALPVIKKLGQNQGTIIIGPGLGISKATERLINGILAAECLMNIPTIIDGDGLSILANNLNLLNNRAPYTTILTPHLGEMARLTGLSIKEIQNTLIQTAKSFAQKRNVFLILKGPRTLITDGNTVYINTSGTEALATAGSGDVLDGIIASFICDFTNRYKGLRTGVFIHGLIGNILSATPDSRCATATDILDTIPEAVLRLPQYVQDTKKRTPVDLPGVRHIP